MFDRFWTKVDKNGPVPAHRPELGPCWIWTASTNTKGYGRLKVEGRLRPAHIMLYEETFGPVPDGLQLDHLCRERRCCRPSHLEPVTAKVNINRGMTAVTARERQKAKTHCPQGHAYSVENTYERNGIRRCRMCKKKQQRSWHTKKGQSL